jgi:uncharacterized membrane protein YeaQ/YmgE (transglycosylase-associated protein family)
VLGTIIGVMLSGFVTGMLARLAVPGPDPMPVWLTMSIGLGGSVIGYGIAAAIFGRENITAGSIGGFFVAVLLVVAYRRFVQKRPLTGPNALRFPERGIGVPQQRERLRQLGVSLERTQAAPGRVPPAADMDDLLVKLNELHKAGVLTDEEYRAKRELVLRSEST